MSLKPIHSRPVERSSGARLLRAALLGSAIALPWSATPALAQTSGLNQTPAAAQASATPQSSAPAASSDAAQSGQNVDQVADIVVTAERRESSIQKTPIAISAISSAELVNRGIVSVEGLQGITPGLTVSRAGGIPRLTVRGIGLTSTAVGPDSSVIYNLDGIPIGRPAATLSNFFDLDRVEVLRGPQGTLYGRNATGGAINVATKQPTQDVEGYLQATVGNYSLAQINGALSGPLDAAGRFRARLAFQTVDRGGYGRNVTLDEPINDAHTQAVRLTLAGDLTDRLTVILSGDYEHEHDNNYAFIGFGPYTAAPVTGLALGGQGFIGQQDVAEDAPTRNRRQSYGARAEIDYRLSSDLQLKSITGYRYFKRFTQDDPDTTSLPIAGALVQNELSKELSQEEQLNYTGDRLKAVAGFFYYHEHLDVGQRVPFQYVGSLVGFPSAALIPQGHGKIEAWAPFAQATYEILPKFELTAGIRYSHEQKTALGTRQLFNNQPAPNSANTLVAANFDKTWTALTPKFGVDYKLTSDVMIYFNATRGFKSGVVFFGSTNPPANPEYVWSYEGGVKSSWFNHRLQANISGFYYDYKDLQVQTLVNSVAITTNAAAARVTGIEASLEAIPVHGLTFSGNISATKAKFTSFTSLDSAHPQLGVQNLAGNLLPGAPRYILDGGIQYQVPMSLPGKLFLRADASYRSRTYWTEFNVNSASSPQHTTVDLSAQYVSTYHWSVTAYMQNVANKRVIGQIQPGAGQWGFPIEGSLEPPRTFGARFRIEI